MERLKAPWCGAHWSHPTPRNPGAWAACDLRLLYDPLQPSATRRWGLWRRLDFFICSCVKCHPISSRPSIFRILVKVPRVWRNSFPSANLRGNSLRRSLRWGRVRSTSLRFMYNKCIFLLIFKGTLSVLTEREMRRSITLTCLCLLNMDKDENAIHLLISLSARNRSTVLPKMLKNKSLNVCRRRGLRGISMWIDYFPVHLSGTAALEEDAQILKVIEAYCTSAKTRQTLNSSKETPTLTSLEYVHAQKQSGSSRRLQCVSPLCLYSVTQSLSLTLVFWTDLSNSIFSFCLSLLNSSPFGIDLFFPELLLFLIIFFSLHTLDFYFCPSCISHVFFLWLIICLRAAYTTSSSFPHHHSAFSSPRLPPFYIRNINPPIFAPPPAPTSLARHRPDAQPRAGRRGPVLHGLARPP